MPEHYILLQFSCYNLRSLYLNDISSNSSLQYFATTLLFGHSRHSSTIANCKHILFNTSKWQYLSVCESLREMVFEEMKGCRLSKIKECCGCTARQMSYRSTLYLIINQEPHATSYFRDYFVFMSNLISLSKLQI